MSIRKSCFGYLFGLLVTASMLGCGGAPTADYEKLGLVDISGTVTLDGAPLADAVVMFEAPDTTFCYGTTDAQGRYVLKLNSEKMGVIPGPKIVRISTTASTGEEEGGGAAEEVDPDAAGGNREEKVPACYHKDSKLTVTVADSDPELDFDLQSDCSTVGPT
jgi:hypothetical protein